MNKVILVGRLTRNPEVKNTTSGRAVATFTLAVDRRFKNKDGQKEADFIPIVFWGKQAELVGQYLSKGSQIGVSGRLQVRSYDAQDGTKRYVTEVVGDEMTFISTNGSGQSSSPTQAQTNGDMSDMGMDDDFHLMADDDDSVPF
ncbi:MAG: single-strand DNA-binding protein [Eubacteriaceae bacterium]|nr:single-strand DNA-binding protein [Eubacteriaceae bacterium]MDK2961860.1 single-strand DNA-binding protein [Eubacteriaceae bacterium]MDN5289902.1 single-strand DNA-binding protein [Anaerophaga sp.]